MSINFDNPNSRLLTTENYSVVHSAMRDIFRQHGGSTKNKIYSRIIANHPKKNFLDKWIGSVSLWDVQPSMFYGADFIAYHEMRNELGLGIVQLTANVFRLLCNSSRLTPSTFEQLEAALKQRASRLTEGQKKLVYKAYSVFLKKGGEQPLQVAQMLARARGAHAAPSSASASSALATIPRRLDLSLRSDLPRQRPVAAVLHAGPMPASLVEEALRHGAMITTTFSQHHPRGPMLSVLSMPEWDAHSSFNGAALRLPSDSRPLRVPVTLPASRQLALPHERERAPSLALALPASAREDDPFSAAPARNPEEDDDVLLGDVDDSAPIDHGPSVRVADEDVGGLSDEQQRALFARAAAISAATAAARPSAALSVQEVEDDEVSISSDLSDLVPLIPIDSDGEDDAIPGLRRTKLKAQHADEAYEVADDEDIESERSDEDARPIRGNVGTPVPSESGDDADPFLTPYGTPKGERAQSPAPSERDDGAVQHVGLQWADGVDSVSIASSSDERDAPQRFFTHSSSPRPIQFSSDPVSDSELDVELEEIDDRQDAERMDAFTQTAPARAPRSSYAPPVPDAESVRAFLAARAARLDTDTRSQSTSFDPRSTQALGREAVAPSAATLPRLQPRASQVSVQRSSSLSEGRRTEYRPSSPAPVAHEPQPLRLPVSLAPTVKGSAQRLNSAPLRHRVAPSPSSPVIKRKPPQPRFASSQSQPTLRTSARSARRVSPAHASAETVREPAKKVGQTARRVLTQKTSALEEGLRTYYNQLIRKKETARQAKVPQKVLPRTDGLGSFYANLIAKRRSHKIR